MNELINIPHELTLFYVDKGSLQTRFFVEIVDKKTLNNKKRDKIINFIINNYWRVGLKGTKKQDVNEINIMNTSFQVILDDNYKNDDLVNIRTSMSGGCQEILVRIQSEEIDAKFFGKPVYTYIRLNSFLKIINTSRNINNGNIQGGYYIGLEYSESITMILDDSTNKSLEESKRIGKLFGTKNKTSKWIPGYKYALTPTSYVIYLGKVNFTLYNSIILRQFRNRKTVHIFDDMFSYNAISEKITGEVNLCISSDYLDDNEDIKNFIIEGNTKIEDILRKLLSLDNIEKSYDCISLIKESSKRGVEVDKCINISDNFNLETFILDTINYHLNNLDLDHLNSKTIDVLKHNCIPELRLISINYDYFLTNHTKLRKVILNKISEMLLTEIISFRNSYRNSVTSIDYIFNNHSNYFFPSVHILKNLKNSFGITDEYIKELIDSKLKDANGNN